MSVGNVSNNEGSSIYLGNNVDSKERLNAYDKKSKHSSGTSIQASELNLNQDDITMKKIKAHKEAMKKLLDTFSSQSTIDDDLENRHQHISDLRVESEEMQQALDNAQGEQQKLIEIYGVDTDSQEYQDAKLLEKNKYLEKRGQLNVLSTEEKERLENMGEMTEFQKMDLAMYDMVDDFQSKIDDTNQSISDEFGSIKGIKLELLKSDPMVDAKKEADKIIETANKDIVGALMNEAKDHVDETSEEEQKKAEETKKEKEELEARIEAAKADDDKDTTEDDNADILENNDILNSSGLQKADDIQQKLETEIKTMLLKQQITSDDTKGIAVDEQV